MRIALAALAVAATTLLAPEAKADPYPWCAVTGGRNDSTESCYFKTFERCLDQIQGLGGFCNPNPRYTGPATYRSDKRSTRRAARH